jgi:hypothetical protein
MNYHIDISGLSPLDVFRLFGDGTTLKAGATIEIPEGGRLQYCGMIERRAVGAESIVKLILEIGTAVGASVAANYIYDKLKRRNSKITKITINRIEIEFEEGEIKKFLQEKITKDQ